MIDTGVAYDHPDFAGNIWTNDDPAGGGDNDGNGFVDDTHGWDFVQEDAVPLDFHYHGTHVAGTIGAKGNNDLGLTGRQLGRLAHAGARRRLLRLVRLPDTIAALHLRLRRTARAS